MKAVTITQISPEELQILITNSICSVLDKKEQHKTEENLEPIFTRDQAANYLQIDLSTLNRWTKNGKIESYGIGNRVYYKRTDIEKSFVKLGIEVEIEVHLSNSKKGLK